MEISIILSIRSGYNAIDRLTAAESRSGGVAVSASYDGHARLESYDRTSIGGQTYSYNGLGDRVRVDKPTGTRHFVYDSQGRVIAEYGASASEVKAEFIWALPPAANDNSPFGGDDGIVGYAPLALVAENGLNQLELYWVQGNHLGVPIVTTNALGQVVDPGTDFLRPGFPGQSQVLSDLYYNRARDYDPVLGRYIQADPIGLMGDVNPYLYANGDPVNMMDPDGELAQIVIPIIVGALIGGGLELLSQAGDNFFSGRDVFNANCYDWRAVGLAGAIGATGGGTGFRLLYRLGPKSLTRITGKEWSHAIPERIVNKYTSGWLRKALNQRGGLNGSWATPRRHYRHDPKRWPKDWRDMGDRLHPWVQNADRIPDWLKISSGSGFAGAAATGNDR